MVELLIASGANVNIKSKNNMTSLPYLLPFWEKHTADLLLSNDEGFKDQTPLQVAVNYNDLEITKLLISHGANVNDKSFKDMTPIHTAVDKNNLEMVDLLVSHGANIEEKDIDGLTPLDHAVINENKEIIEFLISHDANVNAK